MSRNHGQIIIKAFFHCDNHKFKHVTYLHYLCSTFLMIYYNETNLQSMVECFIFKFDPIYHA